MPPEVAAALCAVGIAGLLYLDRQRRERASFAVWIGVAWLFIGSSRAVSAWLGTVPAVDSPDRYLEGSPIDRVIITGLLVIAIIVLIGRGKRTVALLKSNWPVLLFFVFCAASVLWSDFPTVALKRWTKAIGNVAIVLLVLTDRHPTSAFKQLFTRTAFFLIPLSVLFIKYYPALGRGYNGFTWTTFYSGVSTDKNGLGTLCFVFGLASVWRLLGALHERALPGRVQVLIAHVVILAMNLWLMMMANSSTALGCFILGTAIILITDSSRRPATVHLVAASIGCVAVFAYVFQDAYLGLVQTFGRDATLTGRTQIWKDLFNMNLNPWLGAGFETFWLGPRAEYFWNKYYFHPNQAHNGYIEIYITLGILGLSLLAVQFAIGYRNAVASLRQNVPLATLQISFMAVAALYNMTEAAFKLMHPVWIAFLFSTTVGIAPSPIRRAVATNLVRTNRSEMESKPDRLDVVPVTVHHIHLQHLMISTHQNGSAREI